MLRNSPVEVYHPRSSPQSIPIIYVGSGYLLLMVIYSTIFYLWQVEPVPQAVFGLAILVFATALAPLARWWMSSRAHAPMVELIFLAYGVQFSTPIFTQPNTIVINSQVQRLTWTGVWEALWLVELGLITLITAYYLLRRSTLLHRLPQLDLPLAPQSRQSYYRFAFLLGGGLLLLETVGRSPLQGNAALGAVSRLITGQFTLAMILLAFEIFSTPHPTAAKRILLYVVAGLGFLLGLITGMLESALVPLVLLLIARWHATRRIPWTWVFVGLIAFAILNPAKGQYRQQVWFGGEGDNPLEKVVIWVDAVADQFTTLTNVNNSSSLEEQIRQPFSRLDLIHKFVWVLQLTPDNVPYYEGRTYSYLLVAWIPRILWPNKPSASSANAALDVDYRLLYPGQNATISIGQLPEAFANFGIPGIVFVMFLQGAIFATLDVVLNRASSHGGRAIYLTQMVYFLNGIGSSTVMLFGALLQHIIANVLILRYFSRRRATYRRRAPQVHPHSSRQSLARQPIRRI